MISTLSHKSPSAGWSSSRDMDGVDTRLIATFNPTLRAILAALTTVRRSRNSWWNTLVLMFIARRPDAFSSPKSRDALLEDLAQKPLVVIDDVKPKLAANWMKRGRSGINRNGSPPLIPISLIDGTSRAISIR